MQLIYNLSHLGGINDCHTQRKPSMKYIQYPLLTFALLLLVFNSCTNNEGEHIDVLWTDVVTAEVVSEGFLFRTDDGRTLWSANPYKDDYMPKNKRMLINYVVAEETGEKDDYIIGLNWLREATTKDIVKIKPVQEDSIGNDPIEIVSMWTGGGYLNVNFKYETAGAIAHMINLVSTEDEITIKNDTIDVEFRHNAFDDKMHYKVSGIGCFDLASVASLVGDKKTVVLRVKTNEGADRYRIVKLNANASQYMSDKVEVSNDNLKLLY